MKTHHTFVSLLIRSVMAVLLGIGLALLLNTKAAAGDIHLDVIQTKTDLYKDVTVTGHNDTDIYIIHSQGMANVKIKDLDPETLWRVGLGEKPVEPGSPEALAAAKTATNQPAMPAALARLLGSASIPLAQKGGPGTETESDAESDVPLASPMQFMPDTAALNATLPLLIGGLTVVFLLYLFVCYCFKLIVQKTGTRPGFLVWLPILQLIPLLRAAKMSLVWFFLWISPLILAAVVPVVMLRHPTPESLAAVWLPLLAATAASFVVQAIAFIVWCFKIVRARGKSGWVTFFLLLPSICAFAAGANVPLHLVSEQVLGLACAGADLSALIAFLYLAFSSGEDRQDYGRDEGRIVIQSAFSEV